MYKFLVLITCMLFSFTGCGEVPINSHDDVIKLFLILQNKQITQILGAKSLIDYMYSIDGYAKDKNNYGYFLSWKKEPRKGTLAVVHSITEQGTVTYIIPIDLGNKYFSKSDVTAKIIKHNDKYYLKSSDHIETGKLLIMKENPGYIIETTGSFNGMSSFHIYQVMYGQNGIEVRSVDAESVQNIADTEVYSRKMID
jgi:hypothetical protein